ncbi:hypothetical protein CMUS01_09653 [Colletotrichum musicola]|uniref:Uncharacterized protein n=1 Tax=Colletotrichum musicola TaxID=2175873 RepID=A0A8H6NAX5_9PEZI|nr:hypothetical protein CMUS01_09653 [Colletotrichum musicola]
MTCAEPIPTSRSLTNGLGGELPAEDGPPVIHGTTRASLTATVSDGGYVAIIDFRHILVGLATGALAVVRLVVPWPTEPSQRRCPCVAVLPGLSPHNGAELPDVAVVSPDALSTPPTNSIAMFLSDLA